MQWPFSKRIDSSSPRGTEGLLTCLALGEVPSGARFPSTALPASAGAPATDAATSLGGLTQGFCSSKLSAVSVEKLSQDNLGDHSPLLVSKAAWYRAAGWGGGEDG